MSIHAVLEQRGNAFAGEIARQAKYRAGSPRMLELTLCDQGMATKTDSVSVFRIDGAACWFFGEDRLAYSMNVADVPRALREILDSTSWCVSFYDEEYLTEDLADDIDARLSEVSA